VFTVFTLITHLYLSVSCLGTSKRVDSVLLLYKVTKGPYFCLRSSFEEGSFAIPGSRLVRREPLIIGETYGARDITELVSLAWQPVQWTTFLMFNFCPTWIHSLSLGSSHHLLAIFLVSLCEVQHYSHTLWQDVGFTLDLTTEVKEFCP